MEKSTTKFDVVQTGIYKGNYQAKLGYYDKEGKFKIKSYPIKNSLGEEKFVPVSVSIGEKDMAVSFLLDWLEEITGQKYKAEPNFPPNIPVEREDSFGDIPF